MVDTNSHRRGRGRRGRGGVESTDFIRKSVKIRRGRVEPTRGRDPVSRSVKVLY